MAAQGVLAATLIKPGQYEIREYPLPEPAAGCVVVKMELSGICGTDKHTFQGYTTQYGGRQLEFPIIQGHENVGTVAAIGGNGHYSDFEGIPLGVGDRVVVGANVCCGECYYCRHDFPYYCCENMTDYGNNLSAKDPPHLFGGWSQYMYIVPGSFLVKVPDELPSEIAVLTEIFAVSVGLDRAKQMSAFPNESFRFDDTVVVLGVGPLGMCFLMKARMLGAGTIIALDLSDYRLNFAKRLGADHVMNVGKHSRQERLQIVKDLTHGRGADMVIECAGVPPAVPEALEMLRIGGLLVEAGNFSDLGEVSFSPHRHLCAKNARILGVGGEEPAAYGPSMRQMARYMKKYPLQEFVTHRFGLRDVEAAMQKSIEPGSMKVVLQPWQ
ncbi:MAG TPA: zinc-binding dehydrogenase [Terriglobales bacterium]|jgi:threonine dehydrogenase-like Zn-dependent dehydrogenase|nr:zinc-binding dehydrogenase [Terriglobales bacterium]